MYSKKTDDDSTVVQTVQWAKGTGGSNVTITVLQGLQGTATPLSVIDIYYSTSINSKYMQATHLTVNLYTFNLFDPFILPEPYQSLADIKNEYLTVLLLGTVAQKRFYKLVAQQ